jgi:hypothetical protein
MGFPASHLTPTVAERSARHTLKIGCVLRSTGPFRIRLVVWDLVACVSCHGSCRACDHVPLSCDSNCLTLRAVGYDFFLDLPLVTSSPA